MKYLMIVFLLGIAIHPLSFAKYNWKKKNRIGAVGAILIAMAAVIFPSVLLLIR